MSDWKSLLGPDVLADLMRRYAEPHRAYHDWSHVEALLAYHAEQQASLHDSIAVQLAILFHDAIYDARANDNEEASAQLLERTMAGRADEASLARAACLVRATHTHTLPAAYDTSEREDAALFLDMDLAILGASQDHFDRYEAQVRREYHYVPDHAFATGRAAILERFMERPSLYFSEWGKRRFEAYARINLAHSIKQLRQLQ